MLRYLDRAPLIFKDKVLFGFHQKCTIWYLGENRCFKNILTNMLPLELPFNVCFANFFLYVWLTSYEPAGYTILLLSSNLVSFQCWENFSDYSWLSGNGGYHLPCLGRVRFPRTISFENISDYFCTVFILENWIFLVGGIGRLRPTSVSSRFPQWLIISPIWSPNGWWERWCLSYIVIFWSFFVVKCY